MPTFNVLIATVGRPTLQRMLDSLSPQLSESDCLTLVFDGNATIPEFNLKDFKCKVQQYCEPVALGFWGHGIRNKYAPLLEKRDFVMHADDDDYYYPSVFPELRTSCSDTNTLYIAKLRTPYGSILPDCSFIEVNHIGTPCGIIPYELNKKGTWLPRYGGDGLFYQQIAALGNPIVHLSTLIYHVR
jgi:hypothetical protein|uniref:Glycosyltransferase 2-like domain-containing protein n=1 Tax=viral metagenome TaxID=1070528 RepID=A0A6C0B0W5_9ZZZZ